MKLTHTPVLLNEVIEGLQIKPCGQYVDATLGRGGHTLAILSKLDYQGHVYAFDLDQDAISSFQKIIKEQQITSCSLFNNNFSLMNYMLALENIHEVDGILFDLGVSSPQLDDPKRGFSYRFDSRLDMRMDKEQIFTAHEIINKYPEKELSYIFKNYGEAPFSGVIASKIVSFRAEKPIDTTWQLVDIIKSCLPQKILKKQKHPGKQIFQALRIAVNDELQMLKIALEQAVHILKPHGRLAVLTFHSLEDRIVKHFFKQLCTDPEAEMYSKLPYQSTWRPQYKIITKNPITASPNEIKANYRSHSAKLRILEKI